MPGLRRAVENSLFSIVLKRLSTAVPLHASVGSFDLEFARWQSNSGAQDDRFQKDRFCTGNHFAGAGSGLPKFTLGTTRDASDASKYALFGLKPMPGANKLLGNCWT